MIKQQKKVYSYEHYKKQEAMSNFSAMSGMIKKIKNI